MDRSIGRILHSGHSPGAHNDGDPRRYASPLAQQAFQEALDKFTVELTRDSRKVELTRGAAGLDDVQELLNVAFAQYSDERKFPKARKWLHRVVSRMHHYGNIMDVFVQHNPEYVALAWGAMKLVIVSAQNYEETITLISKAMSRIADTLAQVQLATVLYPTEKMRTAVGALYASIIRFFIRAHGFCKEGSARRLLHSLTRPPELRYKDLLAQIDEEAGVVARLANAGSQTQVWEMHRMMADMASTVEAIKAAQEAQTEQAMRSNVRLDTIHATQVLQSSTQLNTNARLTDLQLSQIMAFVSGAQSSSSRLCDPQKALKFHILLQRRHTTSRAAETSNDFRESPKLTLWSRSAGSRVAVLAGNFRARPAMREFSVEVIRELQTRDIPILWALPGPPPTSSSQGDGGTARRGAASTVDILKNLVHQALQVDPSSVTESGMAAQCARFQGATTELEWLRLLGSALTGRRGQVYLVIDLSTVDSGSLLEGQIPGALSGFPSWQTAFEALFVEISARVPGLHVKVLLLSDGAGRGAQTSASTSQPSDSGAVIPVRVTQLPVRQRKHMLGAARGGGYRRGKVS